MIPLVSRHRMATSEGLWTNKMGGNFDEGDPLLTQFFYEGRVDIKELGGHMRIFVNDLTVIKRPLMVTESLKQRILSEYKEERRLKRAVMYGDGKNSESGAVKDAEEDSDADLDEDEKAEKEQALLERLIIAEKQKPLQLPPLSLYLTKKKPKTRMVDAHTQGTRVRVSGRHAATAANAVASEHIFGAVDRSVNYEISLTDIPDPLQYLGLVVLKLPSDEPVTEEPIIYGIVKLQSYRLLRVKTRESLQLSTLAETLSKIVAQKQLTNDVSSNSGNSKSLDFDDERIGDGRGLAQHVKPLHVYRSQATKAWINFQKTEDEEIDLDTCTRFLEYMGLFMISIQAQRIFIAVDMNGDGTISISEFENFLIAHDILDGYSANLLVLDAFDTLALAPIGEQFKEHSSAAGLDAKEAAIAAVGAADEIEKNAASDQKSNDIVKRKQAEAQTATELAKREKQQQRNSKKAPGAAVKNSRKGLDYATFCEAVQMLGVKNVEAESQEEALRLAFCSAGNVREKEAEFKYLSLEEFRVGWLQLANIEEEMRKRELKFDGGLFAESRNRERLSRAMRDVEDGYLSTLSQINAAVERIKQDRRRRKDEKRRAQEAHKEKLQHEANKFIAVRAQEKRLKLKSEQEERARKRLEDKVLQNKLLIRQQENLNVKNAEISRANKEKERLRTDEIRALGLDRIDYSVLGLRLIPSELYSEHDAQLRLSYAVIADFSHNLLEELPQKDFLYWMSEARKLKLSQNRLKSLPTDIQQLVKLEILEVDSNRLDCVPDGLSLLTSLQRLDLSNNNLDALPAALGCCAALRYLCLHSNNLSMLPASLGACFKLEYIDASRNLLAELPEDAQHLVSLTHLDINSNRIGSLPQHIGHCRKLRFLDCAANALAYIPESFSALRSLEYCNFENNQIVTTRHCFDELTALKFLNLKKNSARQLFPDLGCLHNLTLLDVSLNSVTQLPLEIGLMTSLQQLQLTRNSLSTLPAELGSCVMLQKLDVSHNDLSGCVPDTIGLVSSLVELKMAFNDVVELPRSIVGLQKLNLLDAERCRLYSFPDTITYLDKLQIIEVPNNRFAQFPIELNQMKSLRRLNLANNAISLLPRSIDSMTILEQLDLSRNQLRALPVEFTDILESVKVTLHSNPWTDLPPRWGKLWPGTHATDGPAGYNLSDAVDFLYGMRAFYDTAELIWQQLGVFHCTHRLSFEDFLQELRERIPNTWHEGLVEYAKHIYFTSRQAGVFIRWYALDEGTEAENERRRRADEARRSEAVLQSRHDLLLRQRIAAAAYGGEIHRRARHVLERAAQHERTQEVKDRIAVNAMNASAVQQEEISRQRAGRREQQFEQLRQQELLRLQEILTADRTDRIEERQQRKRKPKLPYSVSMLNLPS